MRRPCAHLCSYWSADAGQRAAAVPGHAAVGGLQQDSAAGQPRPAREVGLSAAAAALQPQLHPQQQQPQEDLPPLQPPPLLTEANRMLVNRDIWSTGTAAEFDGSRAHATASAQLAMTIGLLALASSLVGMTKWDRWDMQALPVHSLAAAHSRTMRRPFFFCSEQGAVAARLARTKLAPPPPSLCGFGMFLQYIVRYDSAALVIM
jgi:hypothetical protein